MPLEILYRDERLVAIAKPSGLLTHRTDLDRHETRFAVQLLRDQIGRHVFAAHRLDRGTSGVLLFALDRDAAQALGRQFENGSVAKTYVAIVRGHPPESGLIDHALIRRPDDYEGRASTGEAQSAATRFRTLAVAEIDVAIDRYPTSRYALLELEPLTGRRHQLRRHCKHIAHPIIGDATYGKGVHNRYFAEAFGSTRLLLACTRLACEHPEGGRLEITTPPAGDFLDVAAKLGWRSF